MLGLGWGYFNERSIDDGILTTMWDEFNGKSVDLDDGTVLFILRFNAKNDKAISLVEINSDMTEAVAFDGQLNSLTIKSVAANVNLEQILNGELELYQNVPNPFDYSTDMQFKIVKQGLVKLSVINLLGETVYLHEDDYEPGTHILNWDRNQSLKPVTPGIYLYRLESNGKVVVKKMLIR